MAIVATSNRPERDPSSRSAAEQPLGEGIALLRDALAIHPLGTTHAVSAASSPFYRSPGDS